MSTHESSVNYQNLISDLAEMYPFDVTEVVLIEVIANSLDAKASNISIDYDPHGNTLVIADDGMGMDESQFDAYHDFAAGIKTRGTGIGFAGVGAKISFNVADNVITETCSSQFSGGSNWYLQSRKKLLWDEIQPTHLSGNGTRVEVRFRLNTRPSFSATDDLIKLLRRHYLPLLDTRFLQLYALMGFYQSGLKFIVNGQVIKAGRVDTDFGLTRVREFYPNRAGKRIGYGVFGVASAEYPVSPDSCGVMLCTHGKVIKADLFNQFPGSLGTRLFGLVEIPSFVDFLTTAKTDFMRGRKHREFERLYDPVRQEFKAWLAELGVQPSEVIGTDEATKLERELKKLVDYVPELSEFFGFRTKKSVLQEKDTGTIIAAAQEGNEATFPAGQGTAGAGSGPVDEGDQAGKALVQNEESGDRRAEPIARTGKRGPKVAFVERPDSVDLAWVDGNSVVINSGHPAYLKARPDSSARRLHSMFAIGCAIQRFLASSGQAPDLAFIDRMLAAWGQK